MRQLHNLSRQWQNNPTQYISGNGNASYLNFIIASANEKPNDRCLSLRRSGFSVVTTVFKLALRPTPHLSKWLPTVKTAEGEVKCIIYTTRAKCSVQLIHTRLITVIIFGDHISEI